MRQSDISVRRFREKDAEVVFRIIQDNLIKLNKEDISAELTPRYIRSMSNKRKMYVAVYDDEVVGTASIDFDAIYSVFADVRYKGKGIEERLLGLMEEIADNNGFKEIKLSTYANLQDFYERLDYSFSVKADSQELGQEIILEKYLT